MGTKVFKFEDITWKDGKQQDKAKTLAHGELKGKGCQNKIIVGKDENGFDKYNFCGSMNLHPTGTTKNKERAYKCLDCGAINASGTTWAKCNNEYVISTKGGLIGRDLIINDCFICPIPKKEGFDIRQLVKEGKCCPYWAGIVKFDSWEKLNTENN